MSQRPLILLSNDDGVHAKGLRTLHAALVDVADVVVVAPLTEQSANSHSLTLARPLRHRLVDGFHAIDGTPADCIYVGLFKGTIVPRKPDLVVSGINHGYNLGVDVLYSGTVAAAREGALRGVPAIAFSYGTGEGNDMAAAATVARGIVERALVELRERAVPVPLLSVNFPAGRASFEGIRATKLGRRLYDDSLEVRRDPRGHEYFWVGGPGAYHEHVSGSDTEAVDAGFVSITPLRIDQSEPAYLELAARIAGTTEENT